MLKEIDSHHLHPKLILQGAKLSWSLVLLIGIFALALMVRLHNIRAPGILIEREYTSAIFSRYFYIKDKPDVPGWRKEVAEITKERQPVLEPPITEYLVYLIYEATGKEVLWFAHYLTIAFWLAGGIFMYKVSLYLLSTKEAVVATAYYLLVPSGILVSRSFQPDSLMMLMYLISLFCILRYFQHRNLSLLILAALVSGITLLIRPLVFFAIFGAFISISLFHKDDGKKILVGPLIIFSAITLVFLFSYYGYGIFIDDYMRWKVGNSFRPMLFFQKEFWKEWFMLGIKSQGFTAVLSTLLGFSLLRRGPAKHLVMGLAISYLIFGLFFNYHIHTHGYYHAQLIPIVGICVAPLVMAIVDILRKSTRFWWVPSSLALFVILLVAYQQVNERLYLKTFESENVAKQIGEIVHHSDRTVFLSKHYGLPLQYYGELSGEYWPRSISYWLYREPGEVETSIQERLNALSFIPEYYVITDFNEFNKNHQDLRKYLSQNCTKLAESEEYLIYKSCLY
jgi:hypothetical protein